MDDAKELIITKLAILVVLSGQMEFASHAPRDGTSMLIVSVYQ